MRRREFLSLLAGGTVAWPHAARAQASDMPVIGFLNSASPKPFAQLVAMFHKGLNETGYVEGRNVKIEYRWAEGDENRLKALASELTDRKVALIAATGGIRSAQTAKEVTTTVPVLFISGSDPVELGFVVSYNRPGRNLTGVSLDTTQMIPKRLEVLHELVPDGTKVAVLSSPGRFAPEFEAKFTKEKKMIAVSASHEGELDKAFKLAVDEGAGALLVAADPFYYNRRDLIVALAARYRLPAVYPWREYAVAGGLLSYGPSIPQAYRQIGIYAGRILNGDKPEDLPVVRPLKWELVINLRTAKALGVVISRRLLARVDETLE